MQVAIPVWNNRISPVFESAGTLVVLQVEDGHQSKRTQFELNGAVAPLKAKWLVEHNIDILVCGAISQTVADMITSSGISIIPWVCGEFDEVIAALLANELPHPSLTMPGCCGRRMRARRGQQNEEGRKHGGGHGRNRRGRDPKRKPSQ